MIPAGNGRMSVFPGLDGIFFDLGNTLISFTPKDSMEFVLKWYHSVPSMEEKVSISDFLKIFRQVVREERARMLNEKWETSVEFRSKMIEKELKGIVPDIGALSSLLALTHSEAFSSCLRMNKSSKYVLDILRSSVNERNEEINIGLISNAGDGAAIRSFIERNDLDRYFDTIIISQEVRLAKPWKEIFNMALEETGSTPERSVYIGDRYEIDVLGARDAGMIPIYIRQYETEGEPPEGVNINARTISNILDLPPILEDGILWI